jgi:cob(I)alamin adenosyltransferase
MNTGTNVLCSIDQLNAQLGNCAALLVNHYHQLRNLEARRFCQERLPTSGQLNGTPNQDHVTSNQFSPSLSQDISSLANVLTQVQFDLFDMSITPSRQILGQFESRIDEQAIQWLSKIVDDIKSNIPEPKDPILPIGNQLATNIYLAKNLCHQVYLQFKSPTNDDQQSELFGQYLFQLEQFLFLAFRWSNKAFQEKEWFWKPKSQMPPSAQVSPEEQLHNADTSTGEKDQKPLKRIIHCTGASVDQVVEGIDVQKKDLDRCYICMRKEGQASLWFCNDDDEPRFSEIVIKRISKQVDEIVFTYALCLECLPLLSHISNP